MFYIIIRLTSDLIDLFGELSGQRIPASIRNSLFMIIQIHIQSRKS